MTTEISLSIDGDVATALVRTESGMNVLCGETLDRIAAVAADVADADGVRFFKLVAEGRVFVAGADIKELAGLDRDGAAAIARRGVAAFDAIADLPCVTIARLHGAALGGGLELAMACDFRVAVGTAKIGLPESSLGLVPGWKGISRVRDLAGAATARRLMFSAAMIDANEAATLGLVDGVAENESELDAAIDAMIKQFRRGGPNAIAMIKRAMRDGDEVAAFADCFAHAESREGMQAFIEKRAATWMEG